jgi:phosphopantothenoylcysteine decarboxylase/phosphopantothenate--cysteine ligase
MDAAILSAAVADYRPQETAERKIKRTEGEERTLTLTPNPDIAAALGRVKRKDQLLIGFALETDNEEPNAIRKMERKQLDFIVLNSLRDEGAGFGHDTNKVTIFAHNGAKRSFELQTKREAAKEIIDIAFASS